MNVSSEAVSQVPVSVCFLDIRINRPRLKCPQSPLSLMAAVYLLIISPGIAAIYSAAVNRKSLTLSEWFKCKKRTETT